ncbi:hypothetical protein [Halomonas sp. BC04]|uniref:hypothetical protein n=1 Tax=Halomonas sp. BC04 TaxID=1403540 RepID=UPI0003ED87E3|nr:hypothetical protein [Halomonas sp. BC04]EWH03576.1 hypothetical protein Q427_02610 [Halomonas sp. BC04]
MAITMKRINYTQQGIDVELVLTRDPFNCEWLAVARWQSTHGAGPSLHSMPPLSSTASEADAWEAAKQWANGLVMRDYLKTAGITAKTATAPNSHKGYALR